VNFLKRWITSALAYQRTGCMVVGDNTALDNVPAMGAIAGDRIMSVAEQDIDESNKVDPDPEIAAGVK
jgi:hypothetical protein